LFRLAGDVARSLPVAALRSATRTINCPGQPGIGSLGILAAVFFSASGFLARADELPGALTLDVPVAANLATPAWLGHPVVPVDSLQTLDLPITPPDADAALLVTVYFTETDNGFLRINWNPDAGTAVALASNFYENIGMANSRSLLIPPSTLGTGGVLVLQGTAAALGVQRIEFEWLESRQDLVSPKTSAMLVTTADGTTVGAETVNGQPEPPSSGTWTGDIVTVPITTDATRIEQGVEFSVDLDKVPTAARLVLKETGLALTQHLVVWVNQTRAGTITPAVPGLSDAGFFNAAGSPAATYVGWRNGSFYVPVTLLKEGANTLQFSTEDEVPPPHPNVPSSTGNDPLAVKDVTLQANYAPPPEPAPVELPVLHLSAEPIVSPVSDTNSNSNNP
jgi:hypothetical protein